MGFIPFTFVDFIDILLVALIMFWIYRMTKGTNAPYILSGIIAIYLRSEERRVGKECRL